MLIKPQELYTKFYKWQILLLTISKKLLKIQFLTLRSWVIPENNTKIESSPLKPLWDEFAESKASKVPAEIPSLCSKAAISEPL